MCVCANEREGVILVSFERRAKGSARDNVSVARAVLRTTQHGASSWKMVDVQHQRQKVVVADGGDGVHMLWMLAVFCANDNNVRHVYACVCVLVGKCGTRDGRRASNRSGVHA